VTFEGDVAVVTVSVPEFEEAVGLPSCGEVHAESSNRWACRTTLPLEDPAVIETLNETVFGLPPGSSKH
jgi:hypothetical protein